MDSSTLRACRECGLVLELEEPPAGRVVECVRCGAALRRTTARSLDLALACAVSGAVLMPFALGLPLMDVRIVGRFAAESLLSGAARLGHGVLLPVAIATTAMLVVIPGARLAILLAVLLGARARRVARWVPWLFGCVAPLTPWGMVDIFLLGWLVAYTRLSKIAHVDLGPSMLAIFGVMLALLGADAALDADAIWDRVELAAPARPRSDAGDRIACIRCGRLESAREGERCARCRHRLHARKPDAVARTWALVITGLVLYLPANLLPMMSVTHLGRAETKTIMGGVIELFGAGAWPLGALVFFASVAVPLLKLLALATMLVMTHARSGALLLARARLYRVLDTFGRWSMLDMFALVTLVGLVHMGRLATIEGGGAALPFCGVTIVTMLATELFDPRLMWDASATTDPAPALNPAPA